MAAHIDVKTPDGSYPIIIERGALATVGARAAEFGLMGSVGVITNETLAPLYGEVLCAALPDAHLITMPDGEQYKTLHSMSSLYSQMIAAKLDRSSTVIALGGGVVGDTAGFAAASYMRGVDFVQVPTTLLAMVDSSVGGKVGIDLPEGKNLVGAFKQPQLVLIDPDVLATLPPRERRCGMAELLKHGMIADPELLDLAVQPDADDEALIRRAVQVKVDIVEQDPFEKNIRAHLNLGHTFAHAIEIVSDFGWQHGEAVAIGLVAAARLSQRLRMGGQEIVERVEAVLTQVGLPTRMGDLAPEHLWAVMGTDKKWQGGHSRFVLLRAFGQVEIVRDVPKDDVFAVLRAIQ
jgi:3-dehydroquinate synthase